MSQAGDLPERFERYANRLREQTGSLPARDDLAQEVAGRLRQLEFISAQLAAIDEQFRYSVMGSRVNEQGETEHFNAAFERDRQLEFLMRLLTEAFYYFAFRTRKILRSRQFEFPGFRAFEAVGVRDVRNHLIEHPEGGASEVFNQTWSWSLETGFVLKSARQQWENSELVDRGFKSNFDEFLVAFEKCLTEGESLLGIPT